MIVPKTVRMLPTGAGETRSIDLTPLELSPQNELILTWAEAGLAFTGIEPGHVERGIGRTTEGSGTVPGGTAALTS